MASAPSVKIHSMLLTISAVSVAWRGARSVRMIFVLDVSRGNFCSTTNVVAVPSQTATAVLMLPPALTVKRDSTCQQGSVSPVPCITVPNATREESASTVLET